MIRSQIVAALGIFLSAVAVTWAGENPPAGPATQPATSATTPAPHGLRVYSKYGMKDPGFEDATPPPGGSVTYYHRPQGQGKASPPQAMPAATSSQTAPLGLWIALHEAPDRPLTQNGLPDYHIADPNAFLLRRANSGLLESDFDCVCSVLFTGESVAIHTTDNQINKTKLWSPFPVDYQPTWGELFEVIGRCTGSTYTFDANRDYWVFEQPPPPLPYTIEVAKGWQADPADGQVGEICYRPPGAPYGMDIYLLGRYSHDSNGQDEWFRKLREAQAMQFARVHKPKVTADDMKTVKVDGVDALYLECPHRLRPHETWRQWVFIENSRCFAIVSALNKSDESRLLPDVQAMVRSFHAREPVKPDQGMPDRLKNQSGEFQPDKDLLDILNGGSDKSK